MVNNIHWFGQSSIKISVSNQIIYIDPFRIIQKDSADIILITHDHRDHLDPTSIQLISNDKTLIIAPASCNSSVSDLQNKQIKFLNPWDSFEHQGIQIDAVPAYNIQKTNFHPKDRQYLGYILTINGISIYHAGDTERIPEMQNFDCDIALVPLGQKYTMNSVKEAANVVSDIKAKIAIPIHFGMFEGKESDAELFQQLLKDKATVIIKPIITQ